MEPLVDKEYRLERFQAKGGWTYARIPEVQQDKQSFFGWVNVSGTIDDYLIENYRLMPMGKGMLFLPVKAEIRKAIGKKEGDLVHIVLYAEQKPLRIPEELELCLKNEPEAAAFFRSLSDSEKRYYIQWISAAKKEETRIARIVKSLEQLRRRQKFYAHLKNK